jgi:hypothetical protein
MVGGSEMLIRRMRTTVLAASLLAVTLNGCARQEQSGKTDSCYIVTNALGQCSDLENYDNCRPCPRGVPARP